MAELALYGNSKEPIFPFAQVKGKLDWVQEMLAKCEDDWDEWEKFPDRLNIILVFSRARTSTLVDRDFLSEYKELVRRLNKVLKSVGAEHHTLTIVRRGNGGSKAPAFITCKQSPRFIWRSRPSTLDVGRNLDYIAAGHCVRDRTEETGKLTFIETETGAIFICEIVLLKYLNAPGASAKFTQFNDARASVMNDAFTQLGFPYRAVWELDTPDKQDAVMRVMTQLTPPDEDWWRQNIRWVNQIHGTKESYSIYPVSSFSVDCNYCQMWPIISTTYLLGDKYKRDTDSKSSYNVGDLIGPLHSIFVEVDDVVNSDDFSGDPNAYAKELVQRVEELVRNLPAPKVDENVVSGRKPKGFQERLLGCFVVERMRNFIRFVGEGRCSSIRLRTKVSESGIWGQLETPPKAASTFFHDTYNQ
jgi:hypothetical protein